MLAPLRRRDTTRPTRRARAYAVEMVSTAVKKEGCKVANPGSVAFNFAKKGRLTVNSPLEEDGLLELAIDAGREVSK